MAIHTLSPTGRPASSDTDAPHCPEPTSEEAAVAALLQEVSAAHRSRQAPGGQGPSRPDGEQWTRRWGVRMKP